MKITETELRDVFIIEPSVYRDGRGWFYESWSERMLKKEGLEYHFVQDNHSYSADRFVLRGIHCQKGASAQAKIVRCTRGVVVDVVVDLRKGSPTYMNWIAEELSGDNNKQLLIPRGCGHAFLTMVEGVEFQYKADNFYDSESDRSVRWNDPDIGINWDEYLCGSAPVLSDKDRDAPMLADSDVDFVYVERYR
ncbi:MAG: dTDP-4-dehydrorhamnose 3,5-epimerase [Clostridiales Family XIII bacterium]|jgi:dTDP-4-dehydrorhamnose 3,5-epimerase|nr:dTDP-4-dehydrorhamnose 3,5-epimerase [Clostridiales Family XIII bacterium]